MKAFSLDWGVSFPHQESWGKTDYAGSYRFRLLVGNWVLIGSSGYSYIQSHPNKGFFTKTSMFVDNDLSIQLAPDTSTSFTILNLKSEPLQVDEIYVFDEEYIPAIPPAIVGWCESGTFTLYTSANLDVACLFYARSSSSDDGYLLTKRNLDAGGDVTVSAGDKAEIIFNGYEPNHNPSVYWDVEFRLPELYLGNWVFYQRIYGETSVYVTPTRVIMNPRYIPPGWYYYFEHIPLELASKAVYEFSFGGSAGFKFWVIKQDTQFWFDIHDEYGNVLAFYSGPDQTRHINLKIFEGANQVYGDDIGQYIPGTIYYGIGNTFENDATYELNISFGPFGNLGDIILSGQLYSEQNIFQFEERISPHFILDLPAGERFQETNDMFTNILEDVYVSIGQFVEEQLEYPSHCIIDFEHCGAAGTSLVMFGLGIYKWPGNIHPGFLGVLSHELGHLYSFTPPMHYGVECPLYCEPLATYLGIEGVAGIYGHNTRLWYWGCHPGLFDYLMGDGTVGEIERMQFLFFYIHKVYGPEIHKEFFRIWNSNLKEVLSNRGFSYMEATYTLYSYIVHENLAWLFQLAGFGITEERIDEGLNIIEDNAPLIWANLKWDVLHGSWTVDNRELNQNLVGLVGWAFAGDTSWRDYDLEVDVKFLEGAPEASIGFRSPDENNVYYFCLAGGAKAFTIAKIIGGVETYNVRSTAWSNPLYDKWYHVKIEVRGDRIKTYLNGSLIFDYVASDLPNTGRIGLRTFCTRASFNSLVICLYQAYTVVIDGTNFYVTTESNSTISDFMFIQAEKKISFNVTGLSSTYGFCNVTIPKQLLGGPFVVMLDGRLISEILSTENSTHTSIYSTYLQSEHKVEIIGATTTPEFPVLILLPLIVSVGAVGIASLYVVLKRRRKSSLEEEETKIWQIWH